MFEYYGWGEWICSKLSKLKLAMKFMSSLGRFWRSRMAMHRLLKKQKELAMGSWTSFCYYSNLTTRRIYQLFLMSRSLIGLPRL